MLHLNELINSMKSPNRLTHPVALLRISIHQCLFYFVFSFRFCFKWKLEIERLFLLNPNIFSLRFPDNGQQQWLLSRASSISFRFLVYSFYLFSLNIYFSLSSTHVILPIYVGSCLSPFFLFIIIQMFKWWITHIVPYNSIFTSQIIIWSVCLHFIFFMFN